ncbi:MAG TPA: DUF4097 family beta strand repeat-containing protein [Bryobacteraceae bacterium]|nr:DUF4097 family beta strand repeat-containing protein [Bryobacteraceae bacterium]
MSRIAAFVAACALLAIPARADEWEKRYNVSGAAEVRVAAADGNVEVRTGNPGEVYARVTTQGFRIAEDELRIVERQTGNRVEVELRLPKMTFWGVGNRSIRVEVAVPAGVRAEISTGDGNITAREVSGNLRLSTGDGNIDLMGISGPLSANTGDGNIRVAGRFARLDLKTGDGNVQAEATEGSRVAEPWTVRTGDGEVVLRLASKVAADFELRTGDGGVTVDAAGVDDESRKENQRKGRLNGGGGLIRVTTGDGSIRLVQR